MGSDVRFCTIMPTPDDRFILAARRAIAENPQNAPIRRLPPGLGPGTAGPAELALLTRKLWRPGRELRVKFIGGAPRIRERLIPIAKEWEGHANVRFTFVGDNDEAEIRVGFEEGAGSWSYLGTDALVIEPSHSTMNYGWLTPEGPEDEYQRVVLHEFGHALSCVHEHMHPEGGIPWDREKVYAYYEITQGWTPAEVDAQVLSRYTATETNFSAYDPSSIMHYPVPNELTIGNFEIAWNRRLSQTDKDFIASVYPKAKTESEIYPTQPVEADIGAHGQEDVYTYRIDHNGRRVTLFTTGPTDVLMGLYGPDDPARLVAFDDDSGQALNARIRATLQPGRYWVHVRHWSPRALGKYQLNLRLED